MNLSTSSHSMFARNARNKGENYWNSAYQAQAKPMNVRVVARFEQEGERASDLTPWRLTFFYLFAISFICAYFYLLNSAAIHELTTEPPPVQTDEQQEEVAPEGEY